jgi:WD40-like Beta Propeller Repeat
MTTNGRDHLTLIPDADQQRVLDWLSEPEDAAAAPVLARAFAQLKGVDRVRPRPWDTQLQRVRPEPFGRPGDRRVALLVAAALSIVALGVAIAAGASLFQRASVVVPPPSAPPSPGASRATTPPPVFPLAASGFELVFDSAGSVGVIAADGSGYRQIGVDLPRNIARPDWIPGTNRVLIQEWSDTADQIWDVAAVGERESLVIIPCVEPCRSRNEASPSRQGDRIVFFQAFGDVVDDIPTTCGLAIYTLETQQIETITESPCAVEEERMPRFSPDGTQIAFWRTRSPNGDRTEEVADSAIFVLDLESGEEVQVTPYGDASVPDWSPDGEWLVFVDGWWRPVTDEGEIWRVRPDGSGVEQLTSMDTLDVTFHYPRYTPDGEWILFSVTAPATDRLWGMPAEGGDPVEILPGITVIDYDVRIAE